LTPFDPQIVTLWRLQIGKKKEKKSTRKARPCINVNTEIWLYSDRERVGLYIFGMNMNGVSRPCFANETQGAARRQN